MSGPERQARRSELITWYRNAKQLYVPTQAEFFVVTARKEEARQASQEWLQTHFPGKGEGVVHVECFPSIRGSFWLSRRKRLSTTGSRISWKTTRKWFADFAPH
jgi:hypothetical protein